MKELVKVIAVSLVDHPDEIVVTEKETENSIILELHVAPDDMDDKKVIVDIAQ